MTTSPSKRSERAAHGFYCLRECLRNAREALGLTYRDLARRIAADPEDKVRVHAIAQRVWHVENRNSKRGPTQSTLEDIACALGIELHFNGSKWSWEVEGV